MEQRPILSENEKIAMTVGGESTTRVMAMDGTTAQDVIERRNINNFNNQVDRYVEKFEKHSTNLKSLLIRLMKMLKTLKLCLSVTMY